MSQNVDSENLSHTESDYVRQVLGEPLHHGLCALLLYQPLDPIDFLANYLRYWVNNVRKYRREKIAQMQVECLLKLQLPWNVSVIAEQAKRLEQEKLDEARRIAAEEARKAALERARIKAATESLTNQTSGTIRNKTASEINESVIETATDLVIKRLKVLEEARKKAEEKAKRLAMEEAEEHKNSEAEQNEEEEEEEEGEED